MASSESFFCAIKWILSKDFENRRWGKKWVIADLHFFLIWIRRAHSYGICCSNQRTEGWRSFCKRSFSVWIILSTFMKLPIKLYWSWETIIGTIQGEYCIFTFSSNATWWNSVSVESKLHKAIDTRHDTWNMKERIMYEKTTELST